VLRVPTHQSSPGKTILRAGETVALPGFGSISVNSSSSTNNSSTTTLNLKPGESITLPDGTTLTMVEEIVEESVQTISSEAIRPGESREIPGVGTISVTKVPKNNSTITRKDVQQNEIKANIDESTNNSETKTSVEKAVPENGTVSSISEIKKGVGLPSKKAFQDLTSEPNHKTIIQNNDNEESEDTPENESLADKIKRFQQSNEETMKKPSPPKTAPKPLKLSEKTISDDADFPPPPPSSLVENMPNDAVAGLDFELPPPPPDFIFDEDPVAESLQEKLKKLESRYLIENQTTTSLKNVDSNQIVMSKSDAKYSVTFD